MRVKVDYTIKVGSIANSMRATLKDANKDPQSLAGGTVTGIVFVARPYEGGDTLITRDAENLDDGTEALRGKVRVDWEDGDLDIAGYYKCEFHVTFTGGKLGVYPAKGWLIMQIEDDADTA